MREPHSNTSATFPAASNRPMVSFILQPLRLMIGEHILLAPPVSLGRYYGIYPPSALRLSAWFDPATSAATFTAGMAEYAEIALVGPLARAFAREAPGATLCLLPATGRGLVEQLEHGAIERLQQVQVDSADIHGT